jgi:hypothetical protein|tara:strand:- start:1881 stop:3524 length:1644 start_codon:yes stop_codon:yes gene_type:complete
MADDFMKNLGDTGRLGASLLSRLSGINQKTEKGQKRARNIAIGGTLLGIFDKYLTKNAINAYRLFEQNLAPEKEYAISAYEDRKKFVDEVEKRGGTVQFIDPTEDNPLGSYNIVNKEKVEESFRREVYDNALKDKQTKDALLGSPTGLSSLTPGYAAYLDEVVKENFTEFLSTGGRHQWDKRTQADYLLPYENVLSQAQIDIMAPRNTSSVRKFFGLFGNKEGQEKYEIARDTLVDNHNRFRQKADYIEDYDKQVERVDESQKYKYSLNQNITTELLKAFKNGEASTEAKTEDEFIAEVTKKYQDYIAEHGVDKNTLTSANAFVFTSSIKSQDEIDILGDHKKTKLRLAGINENYDPTISIQDQSADIQAEYKKIFNEAQRGRLGFAATPKEKIAEVLSQVEEINTKIANEEITYDQAINLFPAYRESVKYTPVEIFKSYREDAIENVAEYYETDRFETEVLEVNEALGFEDDSKFQIKTLSDLASYRALLKTYLYFNGKYADNPEEFEKAINSLGPIVSKELQEELLESFTTVDDESGLSVIRPNI